MSDKNSPKRSLRFNPDLNTLAWVIPESSQDQETPSIVGLVCNESATGCNVIYLNNSSILKDETVTIGVGKLSPMKARVVWCKEIDQGITRAGFEYILK